MKKMATILVLLILLGLFTGCEEQLASQSLMDERMARPSLMEELMETKIPGGSKYYENVFEMFCCLIAGEASVESPDGQVSVGATIINRYEHPDFPDTIYGVMTQKWAFSCVKDGKVYTCGKVLTYDMLSQETIEAAKRALAGEDPTEKALRSKAQRLVFQGLIDEEAAEKYYEGGALYFYNPAGCSKSALEKRESILVKCKVNDEDAHIFYRIW